MIASILSFLLAGQAATQQAAPAATGTQQMMDQASQAASEGRCGEAVRIFDEIEKRPAVQRSALAAAAIGVRKGACLIGTARAEEGEAAIRRGLPVLAQQGEGFALDVRDGHLALGNAGMVRLDYSTAAAEYRLALDVAKGSARIRPLLALSRVLAFDHDGQALRYADEARSLVAADPGMRKEDAAIVQTQYARVLLNEGRFAEAYVALKDSLKKQGGLSLKVGLSDIVTRSDLAIAASFNKDFEAARRYLAYTGAGRLKDGPFARATSMQPPLCGSVTGLKPSDYAIVEFSLGKDGQVTGVQPIYATGDRAVALAFANAVADWSWTPEAAQGLPDLFRFATRVELRCTSTGERPQLMGPLTEAYHQWLAGLGAKTPAWRDMPDAKAAPLQRTALAGARAANDRVAMLLAMVALAGNQVVPDTERLPLIAEAIALADQLKAPASMRAYLAIGRACDDSDRCRKGLRALLAIPDIAADPLGGATIRLMLATPGYRSPAPQDASQLLTAVIDAPGLPERHPLKVNALLQRANMLAGMGDLAGARALFERTGLTAEQCALVGLSPAMRRSGVSSDDYPMEALMMGFEGWVKTEFDVAADGSTVAPRVITAYPPFVFSDAGERVAKGFRYARSYRPNDAVACMAKQESVTFKQ